MLNYLKCLCTVLAEVGLVENLCYVNFVVKLVVSNSLKCLYSLSGEVNHVELTPKLVYCFR